MNCKDHPDRKAGARYGYKRKDGSLYNFPYDLKYQGQTTVPGCWACIASATRAWPGKPNDEWTTFTVPLVKLELKKITL